MAEIASAIVGLVAVGAHVGRKTYQAVEAFQGAQDEFLALSNEVSDFRLVLNSFEIAFRSGAIPPAMLASINVDNFVRQSYEILSLVGY